MRLPRYARNDAKVMLAFLMHNTLRPKPVTKH